MQEVAERRKLRLKMNQSNLEDKVYDLNEEIKELNERL